MHTPVLLHEAIEGLDIKESGRYIDATVGEAGHLIEIAKKANAVLGIDADSDQIKNSELVIKDFKNIKLVQGNFAEIEKIALINNFNPVDGILFDLGLSMRQIAMSDRGFSYRRLEEDLDMRLNRMQKLTAEYIINSFTEDELYEIFAGYSEELNSRPFAQAIVRARRVKKIRTVGELKNVIDNEKSLARIFQALRIAVNDELNNLKKGLSGSLKILKKEGRLVVISFHSREDRIVKQFIVKKSREGL